ncbi:hypothetical protein RvY_06550 [Ramazzottius varieornatus]|uniref:Uncharacterized protein n=1 Tax=Ramazzottius varieornatus TaxID=947166 RepID=A0A1D1V4F6_RAMVA|nr:hypothetical protein RvY_06550 [Ramazzottius varieornatus]
MCGPVTAQLYYTTIADYVTNDCNTVDLHVLQFLLNRDEDHPTGLKEFIREWREAGEKPLKRFRKSQRP